MGSEVVEMEEGSMSRLTDANVSLAREIIGRYPRPKSALIPLLHLAQEQNGYVTNEAMAHIAELIGVTPAEVLRHGVVLRDVPVRAGRQVPHQHLRDDVVRAAGRRRADAPRRAAPRHQGRRHDRRRADHARSTPSARRRAPRRRPCRSTTATATASTTEQLDSLSTTCAPAPSTARSRRTARSATVASTSRPTAASAPSTPTTSPDRPPGSRRRPHGGAGVTHAIPWAPGFSCADGDRPQIVTSRFQLRGLLHARALPRHRRLRGLRGRARQDAAGRPRRGQERRPCSAAAAPASRPASKWGLTPQGVWPRYLVVNGDESEPGTYKDRLLMERDPHQLIEGCLIACYAAGLSQCFLYIRGEMAARPGARRRGAQRGLRRRLRRHEHPRHRLLRRHRAALGRRRLRRRRGDGADREPRGQPRHAAAEAAVLPGRRSASTASRRSSTTSRRCPTCRGCCATAPPPTRRSAPRRRRARAWSPCPATSSGPACSRSSTARRRSATCIYGDEFCQGIRDGNELKAFVPGGGSAPWFLPEQLDLPFEGKLVGAAGSMLGSGAVMVMDETDRHPGRRPDAGAASTPTSRAASACRAARAARGWSASSTRIVAGHGHRRRPRPAARGRRDDLPGRVPARRRASGSASTPCRSRTR